MAERRRNWEYRLTTHLLNRRFFLLPITVGLQLLLISALATLFWFTKVQDRFSAQGSIQGQTQNVIACKLEIRDQDRAKVALGSQVRLSFEAPDLEVSGPLLGRVIEIESGPPTAVIVSLQPLPSADRWPPLGQLLAAEEKVNVTVETRTRRLLGLLFHR